MDPDFLEDNDGVRRGGEAVGNGIKPGCAVFGNVFQAPTVRAEGRGNANQQFRERIEITESWSGDAMPTTAEQLGSKVKTQRLQLYRSRKRQSKMINPAMPQ
jgi:hypothetical protein